MKKLLSLLAATGLVATSGSVAVACNKKADDKATTTAKKDLTKIGEANLKLAPNANDEAAAKSAVIDQIKTKLNVTVVEKTDITFSDFAKAESSQKAGSIKVTAVESSALITGSATFSLTFKEAGETTSPSIPDVETQSVKVNETKTFDVTIQNGDNSTILKANVKESEDYLKDVKAEVKASQDNKNIFTVSFTGKTAHEGATIVLTYGEITKNVTVNVNNADSEIKDLKDLAKSINPAKNTEEEAKKAAKSAIEGFAAGAKEGTDYDFGKFKAAQAGDLDAVTNGELPVNSHSGSKLLKGSVTLTWTVTETK
ncbi:hypothetical protein SHELI_v1c10110 [Spiroplasma helicoides]|uniref:Spiralin n=1 Tax=Spiroplasma helicoides TaxID=216938 RepID=A0A1B3SM01_9MOLU|nr:lipoprotein [Spiroplasma helicoides]AOG60958.1 hypothetical protein SHELI_v1c10110 [Spiroplasma helicoides]